MNENGKPSRFPQEMPSSDNKHFYHGVITDVVKKELEAPSATKPAKPTDTDTLNTEFAKKVLGLRESE